jgi:TM2 domain-containing membrane protein YozV
MFCTRCGKDLPNGTAYCPDCGTEVKQNPTWVTTPQPTSTGTRDQTKSNLIYPKSKIPSKWIAAWSFLFPGISQCILGQVGKGIMYMALCIVVGLILANVDIGYGASIGFGIAACIDAMKAIDRLRAGKPIGKWDNNQE